MNDAFLVISGYALLSLALGSVHTLIVGYLLSKNFTEATAQNSRYALLGQDDLSSQGQNGLNATNRFVRGGFSAA